MDLYVMMRLAVHDSMSEMRQMSRKVAARDQKSSAIGWLGLDGVLDDM